MTKDETLKLITKIKSYYPNWTPKVNAKDLLENWFEVLRKYEYDPVLSMLQRYIADDESGFAPSINKLIPKQNRYGYSERIYSHEDFVEMERAALAELGL